MLQPIREQLNQEAVTLGKTRNTRILAGKRNPLDALTVPLDKRCDLGLLRNSTIGTTWYSLFT